jgi:hypothetical protein
VVTAQSPRTRALFAVEPASPPTPCARAARTHQVHHRHARHQAQNRKTPAHHHAAIARGLNSPFTLNAGGWIDASHERGLVFSIEKVHGELIAGDDGLATWAKARGDDFFLPPDSAILPSLTAVSAWAASGIYEPAAVSTFLQVAGYENVQISTRAEAGFKAADLSVIVRTH